MIIFEIKNPKTEESNPATFAQILANFANYGIVSFFKKLLGHKEPALFLEIAAFSQSIHFYLVCEDYLASYFQSQLTSQYPKAQVVKVPDYLNPLTNQHVRTKEGISQEQSRFLGSGQMVLQHPFYLPLNTFREFKETDPLGSILGILSKLGKEEKAVVQIVLVPAGSSWQKGAQKIIDQGISETTTTPSGSQQIRRRPLPSERLIKEKIAQNGLKTGLRLLVGAAQANQSLSLLNDLAGSFGVFARGDGNSLTLKRPGRFSKKSFVESIFQRQVKHLPKFQVLNIEEIVSIFHPPDQALSGIKNISWGGQLLSEPPENLPVSLPKDYIQDMHVSADYVKKEINFFARTEFKNQIRTFGIRKEDRRRHVYLIGKTGTGKTTLIANMAINDMRNGEGLAVIDPHGDLCNILLDYIPKNRINDVAFLDPSDTAYPFRLNPLELQSQKGTTLSRVVPSGASQAELVASGIVSIFYKLYHYSWGPRLEYILRNSLLTLTQIPNSTLADIPPLLSDKKFRRRIVAKLEDKVLINFWNNEFEAMSEKLRSEAVSPILNKVGQFVGSPLIRNIIGHPKSTIDFAKMMNEGKIILANLSQGKLGEDNAALLGAMFITKMQLSAMSRVYQEEEKRRDFYLYVDEFQNFATRSFIKILSEARKYRLDLILANQYIGQVEEEVRKAIFGNVGTLISFLVGAEDARHLSFEFGENYEQKDFVSLGNFKILLKMAIEDLTSTPFYAQTLPLPRAKNQNREKVIRVSRERYTKSQP